ncbi:uncharacterized protein LOC112268707 [Brachypodium distachyon]|uniref:F-box domain-containing protein n=1 Tax=Brachypodium distachyon TaxID=15368 RepID=A0A0Q3F0Z5_BRADI|nr:uncharacterized protein LOC112268707 [Brachypodium distachyon]KQJ92260.1 hypothetical protein BRADI_4g42545v3 [Brachypodium distachyon]|eukprot:XP_024310438.1 uncharacterized protein LOC112268707 [Brachypodium distachyon]
MDTLLPEDVLVEVLRRLSPRSLAALRCVCKGLRAIIDDRRLLRADLLPHSLGGIFINFNALKVSEFFYPLVGPATISGNLTSCVDDHCNGLVLLDDGCVVNPATRQWARLPLLPTLRANQMRAFYKAGVKYLVFDPSVAPHYEVFLIPHIPHKTELGPVSEQSQWPTSTFILYVYSSRTGHWEERPFTREGGDSAGTVAHHMLHATHGEKHYGVYLRGALYVHCQNHFFYKISPSTGKYRVIRPPVGIGNSRKRPELHLGKSENEVRCASVDWPYKLRVWALDESAGGRHEWALKHCVDLSHVMQRHDHLQQVDDPWFLEDANYNDCSSGDYDDEAPEEEENRWSSVYVTFLGFHPFKDVVFLSDTLTGGMAYHFDSSRVQYLGKVYPRGYREGYDDYMGIEAFIEASFPFTPCWMGELSEKRLI